MAALEDEFLIAFLMPGSSAIEWGVSIGTSLGRCREAPLSTSLPYNRPTALIQTNPITFCVRVPGCQKVCDSVMLKPLSWALQMANCMMCTDFASVPTSLAAYRAHFPPNLPSSLEATNWNSTQGYLLNWQSFKRDRRKKPQTMLHYSPALKNCFWLKDKRQDNTPDEHA